MKTLTVIFVCQLFLFIKTDAQSCTDSTTNRDPENSDISVTCGTQFMDLSILLCPIYFANYNESHMIINGQSNNECQGVADTTANPPVLKFRLSLNQASLGACNNVYRIDEAPGTGMLSSFSSIQSVNISGMVVSHDPAPGMITYRPMITYMYSCQYPLQYILNNTELAVAGVNVAINENNGSFISTLTMTLFNSDSYNTPLIIPTSGLNLKEQIFVEVKASNLSSRFNVLLDRCFATVNPYPVVSEKYDLFVGCVEDPQTQIGQNGVAQTARFSFEAFRFVQHKNLTVSRFYLHCHTRLCNVSSCADMLPKNCSAPRARRRREAVEENGATVSSTEILVGQQTESGSAQYKQAAVAAKEEYSSPVVAVIVCVAVLSVLLVAMGAYYTWNMRHKLRL
ncbi:zona pellucida-like domain-containing protein 1 isoform X2 [Eucyclogobius newberryi]|uniref:zona pellucida-like domain-containing protein 1 isoform X2 n=1 Tax=Eucyclogobius newberryi TaxID=166745 RepID=UPI003B5C3CCD